MMHRLLALGSIDASKSKSDLKHNFFILLPTNTSRSFPVNMNKIEKQECVLWNSGSSLRGHQSTDECMHGQVVDTLGLHVVAAQPPPSKCTAVSQQK